MACSGQAVAAVAGRGLNEWLGLTLRVRQSALYLGNRAPHSTHALGAS